MALDSGRSQAVRLERARSLCNELCHMAALQRRRLQTDEPEDGRFVMRRWADWQVFIAVLRRLRSAALIGRFHPAVAAAIADFDARLPALAVMRNVGEHMEDYALDQGRDRTVERQQLQSGLVSSDELVWIGRTLNADGALGAAEILFDAVRGAASGPLHETYVG